MVQFLDEVAQRVEIDENGGRLHFLTSSILSSSCLAVWQLVRISATESSTPLWQDPGTPGVPTSVKGHHVDDGHPSSQGPAGLSHTHSSLSVAINALSLAKGRSGIAPVKAVFGSASSLLTTIRVCFFLLILQ